MRISVHLKYLHLKKKARHFVINKFCWTQDSRILAKKKKKKLASFFFFGFNHLKNNGLQLIHIEFADFLCTQKCFLLKIL